jgi:hypothetical protein
MINGEWPQATGCRAQVARLKQKMEAGRWEREAKMAAGDRVQGARDRESPSAKAPEDR